MTLRRLTAMFLALFLVATVGTGLGTYAATRATITRLVDRRIETASDVIVGETPDRSPGTLLARISTFGRERDTGDIGFVLTTHTGRSLGGNVTLSRRLPLGYSTLRTGDRIAGLSAGRALVRPVGRGMLLTTIAETEPLDQYAPARKRIYLVGFGSIVVVVLGGVVAFSMLVARRFAETRRTVDAIVDGDLTQRVPNRGGNDEFDRQAAAFNRMLDRIGDLMESMRNVSNDVAHDLRTPLAQLRGELALLARGTDAQGATDNLDSAIAHCDQLLAMFAAVLRIGEIEAGERRAEFTTLDLGTLVSETATMMQPVASEGGYRIVVEPVPSMTIRGDERLFTQAIVNLIENALRHTPVGSTIRVAGEVDKGRARITVSDDGPGIAADQRATALRRFGRLDVSRARPGHGLGLPLVAAIARLHGGDVMLGDARPGLIVTIVVPLLM